MDCERFGDALAGVAAGEPAPAAVEAHLASCRTCRGELASRRRALALADAELDGLLAVEPTPELAVRIRQAVAEAGPSRRLWLGWLWPAMAAVATLLVAFAVLGRGTSPAPEPRVEADVRPSPTASPQVAESARPALDTRARRDGAPTRPRAGGRGIPAEPEVLVPPGETETLVRFVSLVYRDRLAPTSLAAAGQPSADLAEPAPLEIKPLEIVPLDPAET